MADTEKASGTATAAPQGVVTPPKRSPGHRGADVKDTVAEMAARAHEISLEAGSKMAAAMKDVINAAAGLSGFVLESARDLVQYMVRRGQMTQEEADKLIRSVEEHQPKRKPPTAPEPKRGHAEAAPSRPEPVRTTAASTPPARSPKSTPAARASTASQTRKEAPARPAASSGSARKTTAATNRKSAPAGRAPARSTSRTKASSKRK